MSETEFPPLPNSTIRELSWMPSVATAAQIKAMALEIMSRRSPVAEGGGWLPISTAPKDGTPVLLRRQRRHASIGYAFERVVGWYSEETDDLLMPDPVGWMPLPAPSQEGASDTGEQKASEHLSDPIREEMARALEEIARKGTTTGYGRTALARIARAALSKHRAGSKASEPPPNPR